MPFEITFKQLPAGYCVNAARPGEMAQVRTREFVSSEDGDRLITCLEGVSDFILSELPVRVSPSSIDRLLAVIRPDMTGTVYINELELIVDMMARRSSRAESGCSRETSLTSGG